MLKQRDHDWQETFVLFGKKACTDGVKRGGWLMKRRANGSDEYRPLSPKEWDEHVADGMEWG